MCLKIWVTMSGKEKTNKTSKKQKGLEYDSPNDSKKPQTLLPKIPVPTTTHREHDNDTADSVK